MKKVVVLGATGSIGTTFLNAVREKKIDATVCALVAHSSIDKLIELSKEFNCPYALNKDNFDLESFIRAQKADMVLNGIAGAEGLKASIATINAGVNLSLANKESVVMGGDWFLSYAKNRNVKIYPVDSEHSAIYHLLKGHTGVASLVITASGGPFLGRKNLDNIKWQEAVKHPTWNMGRKISIDSATLANKGLEVIEAGFLFSMDAKDIEVTIHRQSVIHSMIRLTNGSVYAQMSPPDMTLPILAAVNEDAETLSGSVRPLSFENLTLTFQAWDREEFPLLSTAYSCLERKGSYPIAFNASDEVAVGLFLDDSIRFTDIATIVRRTIDEYNWDDTCNSLEEILKMDNKARIVSREIADGLLLK
ncbi:MAG: 1-deoxy-D-xylulose-5-phosphate reductoisomerase [Sphaerochaetaceae bacterium]|nr:1-deoxy-D-xylulose-5-phosphate reductoisomerase [Sphaerochaetaceae bacterium]